MFIVSEIHFEYNDEYYIKCNGDPGHPKKIFHSYESAEQFLWGKTLESVRGKPLYEIPQDSYDGLDEDVLLEWADDNDIDRNRLNIPNPYRKNQTIIGIPADLTIEECKSLSRFIDLNLFSIIEVPVEN